MKLQIRKAGINGEGIGFHKRKPVFIEGCFPDETVECELEDQGRYYRGKLIKVLRRSPSRKDPECPYHRICGACTLMALEYEEQLRIKKQLLEGALYKYAGYDRELPDVIPSSNVFHYRNKCNLPVFEHDGKLTSALYRSGSNHPVLIDECLIHDKRAEEIRKKVLNVLNRHGYKGYVHKEKKGIRQLVIRGFEDEYQLTIVSGNDVFDERIVNGLKDIKGLISIYQGTNTRKDPVHMMPEKLKLLSGKEKISLKTGNYELCLSPQAFFQLNREQAERIYADVSAQITDRVSTIVEAYSGIGAISLYLHDRADEIIGIELEEKAVNDAKENAKLNAFSNLHFICEDASKALRRLTKEKKIDVLVVDPPRTGLDEELLKTLTKTNIGKIIYVSCNPATLGKDLNVLQKKYSIESIQGYDMFPNTAHCESVTVLKRR